MVVALLEAVRRVITRLIRQAGFAATDSVAIVAAMSIIAAAARPHLNEYLEAARLVTARREVQTIAVSLVRLANDVGYIRSEGLQVSRPMLLIGDGTIPHTDGRATTLWANTATGDVQPLTAHLVENAASYSEGSVDSMNWRGPYTGPISADPWGRRYASNVQRLSIPRGITVVLSAGPNGIVETPFDLRMFRASGDDVVALVSVQR